MNEQEFLKKIRSIEISMRRLVQDGLGGQYLSAFRGSGMQFREFRPYVFGDDVRHISWTVSARTNNPVIKTFEEERERTLFLLVDVSASLRRGPWAQHKAERLAEIAAVLALSAQAANDHLGMILFSDHVEKIIPPAKGKTHLLRLIREVLGWQPRGVKTSPDLALEQVSHYLKKRSIVFFLSDMEVLPSEDVLRRVCSNHEFVGIGVEEETQSLMPAFGGFLELQVAESGRPVTVDTGSRSILEYLKEHHQSRHAMVENHFRKSRADLLWVNTHQDFVPVLSGFMKKRMRKRGGS